MSAGNYKATPCSRCGHWSMGACEFCEEEFAGLLDTFGAAQRDDAIAMHFDAGDVDTATSREKLFAFMERLRSSLDAGRRDSERLGWMLDHYARFVRAIWRGDMPVGDNEVTIAWFDFRTHDEVETTRRPNARAAIDSAMLGEFDVAQVSPPSAPVRPENSAHGDIQGHAASDVPRPIRDVLRDLDQPTASSEEQRSTLLREETRLFES